MSLRTTLFFCAPFFCLLYTRNPAPVVRIGQIVLHDRVRCVLIEAEPVSVDALFPVWLRNETLCSMGSWWSRRTRSRRVPGRRRPRRRCCPPSTSDHPAVDASEDDSVPGVVELAIRVALVLGATTCCTVTFWFA